MVRHLRSGDRVVVLTPSEILATLDARGCLDGVPFMPEMVESCGRSFVVSARVEKTCVEGHLQRRFPGNDVVFLEELRCSGQGHDGCKRGCMVFWKESWLRPMKGDEPAPDIKENEREQLRAVLTVKTDPEHYFCQSTRLAAATEPFPWKHRPWMFWVALREVWVGNRSMGAALRLLVRGVRVTNRVRREGAPAWRHRGPNKRTPARSLGLERGDWVQIRPEPEIVGTLDAKSRNRGLGITRAMTLTCGQQHRVRDRFDRMISETTGKMHDIENTVTLQGSECLCYYSIGGCPRRDLLYWREIWVDRTPESGAPEEPAPLQRVASSGR